MLARYQQKFVSVMKLYFSVPIITLFLSACGSSSHPIGWQCQEVENNYTQTGRTAAKYTECREHTGAEWLKSGKYEKFYSDIGDLAYTQYYKIYRKDSNSSYQSVVDGLYQRFRYFNGRRQIVEEVNYVDGKKQGVEKKWYDNGQIFQEQKYSNGNIEGVSKTWDKNGQLVKDINYVNGNLHGVYKMWHSNGQLVLEANYINGKREGVYKRWHGDNGQLIEEVNYNSNGEKDGAYKKWHSDGQLAAELLFSNGKLISCTPHLLKNFDKDTVCYDGSGLDAWDIIVDKNRYSF